ncbi:MAG: hypothetical protein A3B25_02445 [Candidatus Ryanbacteria bacterium RIFCSPLOWO2_01_FULL_48_26]|uniref:Uncharacterized protein n=1 Tax=Candidatus Ryanbacteria bacterium RIFCSPLOWO2_01_FULL_48_26 TaxID=1802126 RepID=A0A1G2GWR6_9BACT|nr:MAG: hypothetical protein A3B25_02445 [Candidatus Ryanbacteria bacterium RIFCSPLOWO2_01_FULL_48_26]
MSKFVDEKLSEQLVRATKIVNTAVCWSVRATMIEFSPEADISIFRNWHGAEDDGIKIEGAIVRFDYVRVVRTMERFRVFVGSMPIGLYFPHRAIVKIWDEAGTICELRELTDD